MLALIAPAVAQAPASKLTPPASDNGSNSPIGFDLGGDSKQPVSIEASQGIEWQQNNHVYIARGHATAKRGNGTVIADTLTAHYRPARTPLAGSVQADAGKTDILGNGSQIPQVAGPDGPR